MRTKTENKNHVNGSYFWFANAYQTESVVKTDHPVKRRLKL